MLSSKCAVYDSKKSNFMKEKEASSFSSSLVIKAPSSKIALVSPLLF